MRWFQAGAFQPFFRGHAHLDTKRREPWVFGEPYTSHIRKAIRERYRLLPYIYTLFFESSISGMPIMRSMAHVFPELEETWAMDDQYMLGDAILVNPVTKKDASSWGVYLPPNEIWYDYETMLAVPPPGPGFAESRVHTIPVTLDKIPVFMRGGHLIFRKDRPRRSAAGMARDPYTLVIPLDEEEKASGLLYVDDGVSYDHMDTGRYVLKKFEYDNSVLSSRDVDIERELDAVTKLPYPAPMEENPESQIRIERIYLVGVHRKVKEVNLWMDNVKRPLYFMEHEGSKGSVVLIRDPKIPVGQADWKLEVVDGNKKAAKTKDEL